MYLGTYNENEKIYVAVATHKFETGEQLDGVLEGYYIRTGETWGEKVPITFSLIPGETGLYFAEIDTTVVAGGVYLIIIKALVDTVNANAIDYFVIRDKAAQYGISRYGKSEYV